MLNYAFDPTLVNPVSARVGQQVLGGISFAGVDGAPDRPWKYDKNNYQFRVGDGLLDQREDRAPRRLRQVLPQPDQPGQQRRVQPDHDRSSRRLDGNRTPTYALSNPWPDGIQAPPGSSLGPLTFLGRGPSFSNPDFVVPNVHQFSAGIQRELPWQHLARRDLRRQPQLRHRGELRRLQRAVGGVPGAVRRDAGRQPQPSATSCCRTRSSTCAASRARRGSPTRRSRASS